MRFIKNILLDLRNGIVKHYSLFVLPALVAAGVFFDAMSGVKKYLSYWGSDGGTVSFGDYWFYLYGGMKEYVPAPENPFQVPIIWIIVLVSVSFLVLNYPVRDMCGVGSQILVQTGGRSKWWFSKCVWNVLSTFTYHFILITVTVLLCAVYHIDMNIKYNIELQKTLFHMEVDAPLVAHTTIPIVVFILPVLFSMAINLVQMTLSLFIKPVFSFLTVCVLLISSAYFLSPFMLGNYAMPLRCQLIYSGGVSYRLGIIVSVMLMVISVVTGLLCFKRYDILCREDS